MKARDQCHLKRRAQLFAADVACVDCSFKARPRRLAAMQFATGGRNQTLPQHGRFECTMFEGRWTCTFTARLHLVKATSLLANAQIGLSSHISAHLEVSFMWWLWLEHIIYLRFLINFDFNIINTQLPGAGTVLHYAPQIHLALRTQGFAGGDQPVASESFPQ